MPDALGVVEPVDAEHEDARVAELVTQLGRPVDDRRGLRQGLEAAVVDGDRDGTGPRRVRRAVAAEHGHRVLPGGDLEQPPAGADEVLGVGLALEAEEVGAEEALEDRSAPGDLGEQLDRGEGDVVEPPDPQVGPLFADHPGDELQLVVLHPHRRALRGHLGDGVGEPLVDADVGPPPVAVERRLDDDVVVDRPQGVVAEALVVLLDLRRGQRDRAQVHRLVGERASGAARLTVPPDPCAPTLAHDRVHGGHETAGRPPPAHRTVGSGDPVHRQPVRRDDEVMAAFRRGHRGSAPGHRMPSA